MNVRSQEILTERVADSIVGTKYLTQTPLQLRWAHVKYTSSATAGNRNLVFTLYDANGNVLYDVRSGANQAANLTRHYNFVLGGVRESSFQGGGELIMPLAGIVLMPNQYVTVEDENAVDAADTFTLSFQALK